MQPDHPADHDYHIQCIGSDCNCVLCELKSNRNSDPSFDHKVHLNFLYIMVILHFFEQDMLKEARKGFFGHYSVCETMKERIIHSVGKL